MIFFSLQQATEIFHTFSCFSPAIIPQRGGDSYLVFQFITKSGQCSCKIKFNIFVNFLSDGIFIHVSILIWWLIQISELLLPILEIKIMGINDLLSLLRDNEVHTAGRGKDQQRSTDLVISDFAMPSLLESSNDLLKNFSYLNFTRYPCCSCLGKWTAIAILRWDLFLN